ncbi:MAG TPA: hypothetical protein VF712_14095 [Thermoleophilaceae bacterium]|jgi:uncharacterized protein YegP (UPF0339 family)
MRLDVHEDNSANYHWTLVTADGEELATSIEAFASHGAAARAANELSAQIAAAPLEVG